MVLVVIVLAIVAGSVGFLYYYNFVSAGQQISSLQSRISTLQSAEQSMIQLEDGNGTYPGTNFFTPNSLSNSTNTVAIYNYANESVVTIEGLQTVTDAFGLSG